MATSQSVSDLVLKQWGRCAKKLNFQFIPVPEDTFAEPNNYLSSPLRSPIFVDFNAEQLPKDRVNLKIKRKSSFLVQRMH
jgi:hypothetical protein